MKLPTDRAPAIAGNGSQIAAGGSATTAGGSATTAGGSAIGRREFIAGAAAATLQVSLVEVAFADPRRDFTFAYLSDAHLQHVRGTQFVRAWDEEMTRAIAEANLLRPRPDFAVFGGDLAHLGTPAELEHGADLLSRLACPVRMVIGEHDYYFDLGERWSRLFGPQWYSFDHKGTHFVVLNSILADDAWLGRWSEGARRMAEMAGLENPNGAAFRVGARQRAWLARDLARVPGSTPLVVLSHSPLRKVQRDWNFWTEDAEQVQAILAPFADVTVFHGHVHQVQHARIANIAFHAVKATAWPWPHPEGLPRSEVLPRLTLGADAARSTGWQLIDVHSGRVALRQPLDVRV